MRPNPVTTVPIRREKFGHAHMQIPPLITPADRMMSVQSWKANGIHIHRE